MDKKYQIFISSTYNDLIDERRKVQDTILSMYHFPIGMEMFSAADEDQWEIIKETIDSSDYYVLLIAHRYGTVIESGDDVGISYTEKEYRYAMQKKIPVLAFIIDESVPVIPKNIDTENADKLQAFISVVKKGRMVEWWKSADELSAKVMNALNKEFNRHKRPGWTQNSQESEKSLAEIIRLNTKIRELENENRKLQEENAVYRASLKDKRKPIIEIKLSVETIDDEIGKLSHSDYAISDENEQLSGVRIMPVSETEIRSDYSSLHRYDVPAELRSYVTEDKITDYNKSLPNEETLAEYLRAYKEYKRITEGAVGVYIDVQNNGNCKANDVSVIIRFPEGVIALDTDDIENATEPAKPKTKKNPIEIAAYQYEKRLSGHLNSMPAVATFSLPEQFDRSILTGGISNDDATLYNNCLEFDCGSIIHTKSYWRRGIYVIGVKPGKYQIECTLMCEEYEKQEAQFIDFEVTD